MSELSISYHLRVGDGREVLKALRDAGFGGVAFAPANGWLTFIPYANSAPYRDASGPLFADSLCKLTGRTVLYYCYAEDRGWAFALARPSSRLVQYACWWEPRPTVERDQFDLLALSAFAGPDLLEPLLGSFEPNSFEPKTAAKQRPAHRFAELLRLPHYKRLSPQQAQDRTDDLVDKGGRRLGAKPPGAATPPQLPPDRQVALQQVFLSAREAIGLITPFMARFKPPQNLTALSSYGIIRPDGRGIWQARWRYGEGGDTVQVSLFGDGRLVFRADTAQAAAFQPDGAADLPRGWLDSPDIAAIVARLPLPDGLVQPSLALMTLRSSRNAPHVWEVHLRADKNGADPFVSWIVHVDAVSGDVNAEQLGRKDGFMIVPARRRARGGDWEDLQPPC
jgi:hypothetical protein